MFSGNIEILWYLYASQLYGIEFNQLFSILFYRRLLMFNVLNYQSKIEKFYCLIKMQFYCSIKLIMYRTQSVCWSHNDLITFNKYKNIFLIFFSILKSWVFWKQFFYYHLEKHFSLYNLKMHIFYSILYIIYILFHIYFILCHKNILFFHFIDIIALW